MRKSYPIEAQGNWWGNPNGPGEDDVSGNVDASNRRTAPVIVIVTPAMDVEGGPGTDVNAIFYAANFSDSDDTYDITVSDTLGWNLNPTTLTETVSAGESKAIDITVSIPFNVPNGLEDELTLTATSTSDPSATDFATLKVRVRRILINEVHPHAGWVELSTRDLEIFRSQDGSLWC